MFLCATTRSCFVGALLIASIGYSSIPPEWTLTIDASQTTINGTRSLATDGVGNSYFIATTNNDALLTKIGPTGMVEWTRTWDGPAVGNGQDLGIAVVVTHDGSAVYIASRATMPGFANSDMAVIRYDADGNLVWEAFYDGPAQGLDQPNDLALHPDGGVVVTGGVWNDDHRIDYGTARFDANGTMLWSAIFSDNGPFLFNNDSAKLVQVNAQGDVFVTGNTRPAGNTNDIVTISYDGTTGAQRWLARYDGTSNDTARAMALGQDGSVNIAGRQAGLDGAVVALKYDQASGALRWVAVEDPGFDDFISAIAVNPAGDVFITGNSDPDSDDSNANDNAVTTAFDALGGFVIWQDRFEGNADFERDASTDALIDSNGMLQVLGFSSTQSITGSTLNQDAVVISYNPLTGQRTDLTIIDTTDTMTASDVFLRGKILPDGDLIALGLSSIEFISDDFLLVRFGLSCDADLTGDGILDAADFFAYLNLFAAGDPAADLDTDGFIDAVDFFAYLDLFVQGCP